MLQRTHLAITIFFILAFISIVEHKLVFVLVALFATFLPDLDSRYSKLGHRKIARILQFFTKHRGMIHSFTFLLSVTILLILVLPVVALGFFLGYGLHLFADAFTPEGIKSFYPWKRKSTGGIKTGGRIEIIVFVVFLILDIFMVFGRVFMMRI